VITIIIIIIIIITYTTNLKVPFLSSWA